MSWDQAERTQLQQLLEANQVKPERAAQCVDIACHAAERAVDALKAVVQTAPDAGTGLIAFELALQLAILRLTSSLERTQAMGEGLPRYQGTVEIRS